MIPVPDLDDRTFADLVQEARSRVSRSCPEWTDLSVHDPGVALLEAFAHLTEVMLYRINRLPAKAYLEFLNLLGVTRHPPAAAGTVLTFSRPPDRSDQRIVIPAGTRVAAARGADPVPVVFVTSQAAALAAGESEVDVRAHHCELIEGELLGVGNGLPGQFFTCAKAPLVTTGEPLDVLLGVEVAPGELADGAAAREFAGRTYAMWTPVHTFAGTVPGERAYLLDRGSGAVTFAPALDLRGADDGTTDRAEPATLATPCAVPPAHRQIRIWYRIGGGPTGNVAAGTLTSLKDPIDGVRVSNADPARGGRGIETVEAAVRRGPYEMFALNRAVTARDFELLATAGSPAVARARAFTRKSMWSFAKPGEVEVILVPYVEEQARPGWRLDTDTLVERQVDDVRAATTRDLDERRALGTSVTTTWARYKTVSVRGRVVVGRQEDAEAVQRRIHDRLYQAISPLPAPGTPQGWVFGEPLRASNIYRMLEQAEPGVRYVEDVRFVVEHAPDKAVRAIAADRFQPGTWYAGADDLMFRSTDDGQGWELVGRFEDEVVRRIVPALSATRPGVAPRPGAVAVITASAEGGSVIYVSADLGESWEKVAELEAVVADAAWIDRADAAALLLATDVGLYELSMLDNAVPLQILVDPKDHDRAFYAVTAFVSERGQWAVAVAAQTSYGVYLSTAEGRPNTYKNVGLVGVDTRTMSVQLDGPNTVLWVGAGVADPSKAGKGCYRARLFEADVRWQELSAGWAGGTCWSLDFRGSTAVAATQSAGVLTLDASAATPQWQTPSVNCGLPLRDRTRFEPAQAIAVAPDRSAVIVGGPRGLHRGVGKATGPLAWSPAASRELPRLVTIPETWLLTSGEHAIEVVSEDARTGR